VGYGGTYAAPIASLIVEKYLNDTLRSDSRDKVESIANSDLMPTYLVRAQFLADSIRAAAWALQTGDSARLQKYINRASRAALLDTMHRTHTFMPLQPKSPADKPKQPPMPKSSQPVKGATDSTR
jgi:hypothetical protein